ncbi:MAG: 1-acyl-sn-glycerol-3-phosphate acyltransferase [Balneolaceae bacterium]|nr:1-acyl-sn-glycerol-3-phosphate acyltransferase [Balneolaceae bacterium]
MSIFGADKKGWSAFARYRWGRSVSKIIGMRIHIEGEPPKPPFFLVANHLSYIDIWALFSTAKGTFIAKSDIRNWPIAGFVLATSGLIFVDRSKRSDVTRVNAEITTHLTPTQGIFLFPESTTSNGEGVLPFKSSLFQYPAQEEIPVSTATITYTCDNKEVDCSLELCWWNDTPFPIHFWNVLKIKQFDAHVTFSTEKLLSSNRKELANKSYHIVANHFKPVNQKDIHEKETGSITV